VSRGAFGMDAAVSYHPGRDQAALAKSRQVALVHKVKVFDDVRTAEPFWRRLEAGRALATPYQRFDLLASWQHHVGARSGITPFIVVGFDIADEPVFLWPFGHKEVGPLGVINFLGSKHANFNIGLWRRDIASVINADEVRGVFTRLADSGRRVDLAALVSQPLGWDGIANPFLLLPHQAAVDDGARQHFEPPPDNVIEKILSSSMRSRLRTKERKLQKLPGYRYIEAATSADIDRLLDVFFVLKATHMASQGLTNVFTEPGVADFLREMCHRQLPDGRPLIELHALEGGGEVLAVFGTIADEYRFSSMFNTYTLGPNGRYSPGLILLSHMVSACAARGVRSFDIGVGRASYKSFFCRETEQLFDVFYPLTARGRVAAGIFSSAVAAKRTIKAHPALWGIVQRLRRLRARDPAPSTT
jgi:CelD/BcsL family acetyltransferase involved in cellulose biosynthesis